MLTQWWRVPSVSQGLDPPCPAQCLGSGLPWAWVGLGLVTGPQGTPTWGSPLLCSQFCGCSLSPALRLKVLLGSFPLSVLSCLLGPEAWLGCVGLSLFSVALKAQPH